ncbi:NrfD/PsrC family molybdoenzyme membrane anchor subunit [Micromonospora chokoriensis]
MSSQRPEVGDLFRRFRDRLAAEGSDRAGLPARPEAGDDDGPAGTAAHAGDRQEVTSPPQRGTGRRPGRRRGGRGGEEVRVPEAEFTSYYGRPILKGPVWKWDIAAYLFTGGLAAGSSLLAAGGQLTGRPALRRAGRVTALAAVSASAVFLVKDLGRPARFHHMLRVAKPTSPMSMGTWILTAYGPAAGVAAVAEAAGVLPRHGLLGLAGRALPSVGHAAGLLAAGTAPALATYTGVLLADTAVPSWHEAYPELPVIFAGSALASGAAVGLLAAPPAQAGPARRMAVALGAAAVLGAAPLLLHSLLNGRNPLHAVLAASGANATAGWADRLHGGLLLGPPLGMGFCDPGRCATWQLWWALALPLLLALGAVSAWRALRSPASAHSAGAAGSARAAESGVSARVAAAVQLALVLAAVATVGAYTVSSSAGLTPVESSRYLSCLLISLPALLWPVWTVARDGLRQVADGRRGVRTTLARSVAVVLLVATVGTAAHATWRAAQTAPATRADEARHTELVGTLRQLGVRHVRAGYWTCNRLTFASAERVVCAVVDDDLRPGFDRYPAYRREVDEAAAPAWVAPAGSPLADVLDERRRAGNLDLVTIDGWRIYLPR